MNVDLALATPDENHGNFIIRVTLVDNLDIDIYHIFYDLVDIYLNEYSRFGHFNMNLSDALYSDTSNGEYTTEIMMPSINRSRRGISDLHRRSCTWWR